MLPTLDLGPLVLPTAGLVFIAGAWLVLSATERAAKKLALNAEASYTLVAIMMAAAFIGARLVFVILHWPAYQGNLLSIFWPLTSGFNWAGGLISALTAGVLYGRVKQLPPAATLDALAPGLMLSLMALSLADFLGGQFGARLGGASCLAIVLGSMLGFVVGILGSIIGTPIFGCLAGLLGTLGGILLVRYKRKGPLI